MIMQKQQFASENNQVAYDKSNGNCII